MQIFLYFVMPDGSKLTDLASQAKSRDKLVTQSCQQASLAWFPIFYIIMQ